MTTIQGAPARPAPTARQIRRWIKSIGLDHLPSFMSAEEFLELLAELRQRPILLMPEAGLPPEICAFWVATEKADHLVIDTQLEGPRRELVIYHEVGHILFDHDADPAVSGAVGQRFRSLVPSDQVRAFRARSHYDDYQEWQAEWLASYLLSRTLGTHRSGWLHQPGARYIARLLRGRG